MRKGGVVVLDAGSGTENNQVADAVASGRMVRVYDAVYTDVDNAKLEAEIYDLHAVILARLAPGSVLSGLSGIRGMPFRETGPDGRPKFPGWLFATHPAEQGPTPKKPSMPGLEIRTLPGPGALEGDIPYLGIYRPSVARQCLDNLMPSRSRNGPRRTVGREGVERRLAEHLEKHGREALSEVLSLAVRISGRLKAEKELAVLEEIVAGLTLERDVVFAAPELRTSHRRSDPYDQGCLKRLVDLATELRATADQAVTDPHLGQDRKECVAFIEAYFSNYIEGTKFLVEKARRIVFHEEVPDGRTKDSHDVLATYRQVVAFAAQSSMLKEGAGKATSYEAFEDEIRDRHRDLMAARPEVRPGFFKNDPNRAGNHVFVLPNLVRGTLREGFQVMQDLDTPWRRALFSHCLSVMVHPFDDGNGRISRILMNKELVGSRQCRIVVPAIFRNDYIGAMRAMSRPEGAAPGSFIRAMTRCRDVTAAVALPDLDQTVERWASTCAFLEDEKEARLEMPNDDGVEWRDGIPAPKAYWRRLDDVVDMSSTMPGLSGSWS